jgi:uncharacterized metal-binding protein YceD (DUF177 family)
MSEAQRDIPPEFSHILVLDDIPPGGLTVRLEADAAARARLAVRFGLLSLDRLVASLTVTRGASGIPVRVWGHLEASVVQECVVSLEPVSCEINELIEVSYAPAAEDAEEEAFSLDQPDPPEPLEGDTLELGELVAQHLSIGLDPYPRKAGAKAPEWDQNSPEDAEDTPVSPFAVLERLWKNRPS